MARRNTLTGLWAAKVLGLPVENHAAYAWSVHFADFEQPGDEDILSRLAMDTCNEAECGCRTGVCGASSRRTSFVPSSRLLS